MSRKYKNNEQDLIDDLKKVYNDVGCIPSRCIYKKHGKFNPSVIERRFKKWNNALLIAFNKIVRPRSIERLIHNCLNCEKKRKTKNIVSGHVPPLKIIQNILKE